MLHTASLIFIFIIIRLILYSPLDIPGEFPTRKVPTIHVQPSLPSNLRNEYFKTLMYIGPLDFFFFFLSCPSLLFCPSNLRDPFPMIVLLTENADTPLIVSAVHNHRPLSRSAPSTPVSSLP